MNVEHIIRVVCREYNCTHSQLRSKERSHKLVEARYIIFDLLTKMKFNQDFIGDIVKRDRSMVPYGLSKVKDWLTVDRQFKERHERITSKLNGEER